MNITIDRLQDADEQAYEAFLARSPLTLLYHGAKYRRLLRELTNAEDWYLIARDPEGAIVGALPSFLKRDAAHGSVLNSLPYYGSNGGVLEFDGNPTIRERLVGAFEQLAADAGCISSTIVTSPFETDHGFYEASVAFDLSDERLGQVTPLPGAGGEEALMALFHHKARNAVRKAMQQPLVVSHAAAEEAMPFLVATHQQNIGAKGGLAKSARFFSLVAEHFEYGRDFDVWVARHDGHPVAALLLFYYNQTVEYHTPVVVPEYRSWQPLSRLITEAMQAAVARGFRFWNWGGTWATQESLRRFKQRLGARDYPYRYYTRLFDRSLLERTPSELLEWYPWFFVVPFHLLRTRSA